MVIDFHTHIFPETIAEKTIQRLENKSNIKARGAGTLRDLEGSMRKAGVDISVVLPVVTKPSQFETVNQYAAKISGKDGIISFGGIHPDSKDYKKELDTIKELGLLGIKLHPDYQQTYFDDEKYARIIHYATELGLIISVHAGIDIGYPDNVHCTPQKVLSVLKQMEGAPDLKMILAHTGGFRCWDQVEEMLVGQNVYLDLSYSLGVIQQEKLLRIIRNHGADKILFATDYPWAGQKETLEHFLRLPLEETEKKRILYKNAKNLLVHLLGKI